MDTETRIKEIARLMAEVERLIKASPDRIHSAEVSIHKKPEVHVDNPEIVKRMFPRSCKRFDFSEMFDEIKAELNGVTIFALQDKGES